MTCEDEVWKELSLPRDSYFLIASCNGIPVKILEKTVSFCLVIYSYLLLRDHVEHLTGSKAPTRSSLNVAELNRHKR